MSVQTIVGIDKYIPIIFIAFQQWDSTVICLDIGDLDLIFEVTIQYQYHILCVSALSAIYVLNQWVDFDQTCT